jgi:signal transduction histidine kinase
MRLYGDETLLSSALLNLLDNAHKYSPPKSPVGIAVILENGQFGIQVSDVGIGIATEDLARIFEKSVRLNPEGGTRGMGLGLYLVRRIAAAHGGRIEVSSIFGQGSVFTLWLPLSP